MLDIIDQAKNAIETYNSALEVHSANIANMSVNGYKKLDISFQSIFDKLIKQGTAANVLQNTGGTNPTQYGQGVAVSSVNIDMSQGAAVSGAALDAAITGQGLFIVSPDNGSSYLYTRDGHFSIANGSMVTQTGMQVYGINSSGSQVAITGLTADPTTYTWGTDGQLLASGVATGFRLGLSYFANPQGLQQAQGTTLRQTMASGSANAAIASGGIAGTITPQTLEQSNVFYLGESLDSIDIQRAMSANLSVAKMASDIIQSFITKLG